MLLFLTPSWFASTPPFLLYLPHKHSTLNKMYFVNIYTQESVCLKWFLEEAVHKYNPAFIWKI